MQALTYLLRLRAPLLATQTGSGEPNSATGASFVTGSMIRGALVNAAYPQGLSRTADPDAHRVFFGGGVRFLNAYPAYVTRRAGQITRYERLLPAPRSLRQEKSPSDDQLYNFAIEPAALTRPKSFVREPQPWFVRPQAAGALEYYRPARHLTVHNASEDRNQKKAGISQLFRYLALGEGEYLAGAILGAHDDLRWLAERAAAGGEWFLGGSRTAGYGLVYVEQAQLTEWDEYAPADAAGRPFITLTLLSDAIVRDPQGNFSASLDSLANAAATQAFVETRVVGGFNRSWGLPYPQAWSMAAGSVFVYPSAAFTTAQLDVFREDGLGERRLDGFGRVAVDWLAQPKLPARQIERPVVEEQPDTRPALPLAGGAARMARQMAERRLRQQLEAALIRAVVGAEWLSFSAQPAQLARVRLAARQCLFTKTLQPLREHLNSLFDLSGSEDQPKRGKAKVGARQLEAARLKPATVLDPATGKEVISPPVTLLRWLDDRVALMDGAVDVGPALGVDLKQAVRVAGQAWALPDERRQGLQIEFTARLVEGCLKSGIQRAKLAQEHVGGKSHG